MEKFFVHKTEVFEFEVEFPENFTPEDKNDWFKAAESSSELSSFLKDEYGKEKEIKGLKVTNLGIESEHIEIFE